MSKLGRIWLLAAAAIATPVLVQAQSTTAFDGEYVGVSRVLAQDTTPRHACVPSGALAPLTITNGTAHARWGDGTLEGQATPQGTLAMRATNGAHFDGQIQGSEVKGRIGNFVMSKGQGTVGCSYDLTWRKRP